MLPALETRRIAQSNFFSGKQNLIAVTIMSNIDLASEYSSHISICCLESAQVAGEILSIHVSGDGQLPEFCIDEAGTGGAGQVYWDAATYGIRMHLCPEAGNKVSSWSEFVVSFNVTNPAFNQESPSITISASATAPGSGIEAVVANKPGLTVLGVTNGTDPMRVVVPEFVARTASQSTVVSGATNKITVELQVSVDLSGADGSVITLSNLTGAVLGTNVSIEAVAGGHAGEYLFCENGGESRMGTWHASNSSLTLQLCPETTMNVGVLYAIAFTITNPLQDQNSPSISIEASGEVVQIGAAAVVKDTASLLSIVGGASPLKVVVPSFTTKSIAQSTPVASVANVITVTLRSSISLSSALFASITMSNLEGLPISA
ncbi:hypothetical protein T484DRAFT_1864123, partial [Baffinella frigidus]